MTWDPKRALRECAYITYLRADLLPGEKGRYYCAHNTIVISRALNQAGRRCALTHELIHAETRDEEVDAPLFESKRERAVDREAARRLIPIERLIEALLWSCDPHEIADELWVDLDTLQMRCGSLSEHERTAILARLREEYA